MPTHNFTTSGTYTLPGDDVSSPAYGTDATVDPGLNVNFLLNGGSPRTFSITSNAGSTVSVGSDNSVSNLVNLDTNGGAITLQSSVVTSGSTINATIDGGGTYTVGNDLLNRLNGSITFQSGGGTNLVGTPNTPITLSPTETYSGFSDSTDVIDDRSLGFTSFGDYSVGNPDATGSQSVSIFDSAGAGSFTFTVFGSNLTPGAYSTTSGGPLQLSSDAANGTDITVCFVRGTRIATPGGEVAVEALAVGDVVATRLDGKVASRPVKWIGWRRVELAAHPRPETVAPVRIQRGAFADNLPHRDLLVSPDHAVCVNDKLICARQLINGTTISQEKGLASVEYFHVELDAHCILLAEGLSVESYLNTGNRGFFANASGPVALRPDLTDGADFPTREAASCVPFAWREESVRPVWQRLAERAAALGQPAGELNTTMELDLRVAAQGQVLRPLHAGNGLHRFLLPKGTTEVRVVSRHGSPTDAQPWLEDRRRLGAYVERISVRSGHGVQDVSVDHPGLSQGWWAVERNGTALCRWTNGDAVLPLPVTDGPAVLEILASSGGMAYLVDAEEQRRAA